MIKGLHHIAFNTRDYDRSLAFYVDLLGLRQRIEWGEAPKRATMLETGDGSHVEIFERPDLAPGGEGPIIHFALATDDPDGMLDHARAAGCEVTMEPKDIDIPSRPSETPVRICFFKGPDGEVVELFKER